MNGQTLSQGYTSTLSMIGQLGQWVLGIGFAAGAIYLAIEFFALRGADEQDYKQIKKRIRNTIYGLIGAALAFGIVTFIKTTYGVQ